MTKRNTTIVTRSNADQIPWQKKSRDTVTPDKRTHTHTHLDKDLSRHTDEIFLKGTRDYKRNTSYLFILLVAWLHSFCMLADNVFWIIINLFLNWKSFLLSTQQRKENSDRTYAYLVVEVVEFFPTEPSSQCSRSGFFLKAIISEYCVQNKSLLPHFGNWRNRIMAIMSLNISLEVQKEKCETCI